MAIRNPIDPNAIETTTRRLRRRPRNQSRCPLKSLRMRPTSEIRTSWRVPYLVPFVEDEHTVFLKTIIPSRKATKQYLGEESDDEDGR